MRASEQEYDGSMCVLMEAKREFEGPCRLEALVGVRARTKLGGRNRDSSSGYSVKGRNLLRPYLGPN